MGDVLIPIKMEFAELLLKFRLFGNSRKLLEVLRRHLSLVVGNVRIQLGSDEVVAAAWAKGRNHLPML